MGYFGAGKVARPGEMLSLRDPQAISWAGLLAASAAAHAAWRQSRSRRSLLGGLLLAGAWFTKWQYGIVATLALVVVFLRQRRLGGRTSGEIWLFAPSAVLLALWLASPYHLREMLMYLLWKPASAGKLTDYARSFLQAVAGGSLIAKANLAVALVGLGRSRMGPPAGRQNAMKRGPCGVAGPWRIWRPSLRGAVRLHRPDTRPPRPQVAPDYVAVVNTAGGNHVARAMADLHAKLALEPLQQKRFPGATVTIYRCGGWRSDSAGKAAR